VCNRLHETLVNQDASIYHDGWEARVNELPGWWNVIGLAAYWETLESVVGRVKVLLGSPVPDTGRIAARPVTGLPGFKFGQFHPPRGIGHHGPR
jgi:hypothetical protein